MAPTREIAIKSFLQSGKEREIHILDPSDSSFLTTNNQDKKKGDQLIFSGNSRALIERAKLGKPMSDTYNARYLTEQM